MKLSIITINYNNKAGLQKTIDSVICQTWKDYEWIIIDGGSTDGSKELIEQYQQHFAYWCSEPDKGVYNAMNKGVEHAHGMYVSFMNSGDVFHDGDVLANVFSKALHGDILIGQVRCMGTDLIVNQFTMNTCDIGWQRINEGFCHQGTFSKLAISLNNNGLYAICNLMKYMDENLFTSGQSTTTYTYGVGGSRDCVLTAIVTGNDGVKYMRKFIITVIG
jgi:glycosyltransferase involved in cell wall biosynthesis